MPNWCVNHVDISFPSKKARDLFMGRMRPAAKKDRAINRAFKMLACGLAGLVRPARALPDGLPEVRVPGMSYGSLAEHPTPADHAYSDLLDLIATWPMLDEHTAETINVLFGASGLASRHWGTLPKPVRRAFRDVLAAGGMDFGYWRGAPASDIALTWMRLDDSVFVQKDKWRNGYILDFDRWVDVALVPEIAGGTHVLLAPHACDAHREAYGTKWNPVEEIEDVDSEAMGLCFEFGTPWSPAFPVVDALFAATGASGLFTYYESGNAFCGQVIYEAGLAVGTEENELQYGEEDEDGFCDLIGPDYVVAIAA
jgi:hypothetical protein